MSLKAATKKEANRVELEVEVGAEAFEQAVSKAYKKNIGKMNVPGFRKGKAPRHLVEKLYGTGVFYEEAMNDIYPTALDEAIKESEYEYVEDKIDLDVVSVGADGLVFKAVITVKPEVTLGEYKGLKAPKTVKEVTDEDVAAELTKLQERNSRMVSVDD
ncbi:MAG: trigger factor family protein, partial [Acutalibacteraceae bacterium]